MKDFCVRAKKILLLVFGILSLITGIVGIFVPLLPTTVFILIAAWCFMRSSDRFHDWLLGHPQFGPLIENWRRTGAIPLKAKVLATGTVLISIVSILLFVDILGVKGGVIAGLCCVLGFIWTRPHV